MNRSVLVVDDEPDIRSLLQEILEDEGYAVAVAETAAAAEASIAESVPDLVLLDIWMPDVDGVQPSQILETGRQACISSNHDLRSRYGGDGRWKPPVWEQWTSSRSRYRWRSCC